MSADPSVARTSPSLLGRIRDPSDQVAWAAFVDRYGRMVYRWGRRWGLQDADAEDVTQQVLTTLAARIRGFEYDPARSFRAWLKTVAHHAWQDHARAARRPGRGTGGEEPATPLDTVEAREDLARGLEEAYDLELVEVASAVVRLRVAPRTWEAYRLTALDGLSGADAAKQTGMPVVRVFAAKSKVLGMIRDEVRRLEGGT